MRMNKIAPVILSGGFGKRLLPISKKSSLKQFLKIPFGSKISLFQKTILRTKNEIFNKPIVICAADHKFIVREQISSINAIFSFSNNNFLSLSKRNVYYIKKKLKC